jgi:ADP-ribosylarginine hydrolase
MADKIQNKIKERFIATFVLHAIGDMIGFKNGEWEFNYHKREQDITFDLINEILYDYISLGGIIGIDFSTWVVSDDTLLHMAIAESIITDSSISPDFYKTVKSNLKKKYNIMLEMIRKNSNRFYGINTEKYILKFSDTVDGRSLPYDLYSGGSGASMRTSCIGLAFSGEKNRHKLIDISIESSRLTHNSGIGYLGGLVSALFTAYAIENIPIIEWPFKLIILLQEDSVTKFITSDELQHDHAKFINLWKKYVEIKDIQNISNQNISNQDTKLFKNLIYRSKFHYDNFSREFDIGNVIGENGCTSVIMAYDCLFDAKDKWETLIIYSALHIGDSDTVASIACSWFGALYGFLHIPKSNYTNLEFNSELFTLGNQFYKQFHS